MIEKTPIETIVFEGERSKEIARLLGLRENMSIFVKEDAFGLDKNKCLFIFDKETKRKNKEMINQALKNKSSYPYSIAILKDKKMLSLVNQIHSDYFINFNRNINRWGFPWGAIGKKEQEEGSIVLLDNSEDEMLREFGLLLKRFGVLGLEKNMHDKVRNWLEKARSDKVNLFSMVCPDYSFIQDPNNNSFKYNNDNKLREGIGLVAIKTLDFLEPFSRLIRKFGLKIYITLGIADYEDYPENLERLGESKESFNKKVRKSIKCIKEKCAKMEIEAEVIAIRDYFGETVWREVWGDSKKEIENRMNSIEKSKISKMVEDRKELYSKWFPNIKDKEVFQRMVNQGTEYTSCGFLFSNLLRDLLILGTNSINMEFFYRLKAENLPVLYVTRVHK